MDKKEQEEGEGTREEATGRAREYGQGLSGGIYRECVRSLSGLLHTTDIDISQRIWRV